jgi:hypothetical protein
VLNKNRKSRIRWAIRDLPIEVYDYAAYLATHDPVLRSINANLIDMLLIGFDTLKTRDRDKAQQRVADLERENQERQLLVESRKLKRDASQFEPRQANETQIKTG